VRSHGPYQTAPNELLRQVNITLWTSSAGDHSGALFYGIIEAGSSQIRYASAGGHEIVRLHPRGWQWLTRASSGLGEGLEADYQEQRCTLPPGEALVVYSQGLRNSLNVHGSRRNEADLAEFLVQHLGLPAKQLADLARCTLENVAEQASRQDSTLLVVKRVAP
jgi:serine phosphatase RsbU (regulator of sigma subunit)